MSDNRHGAIHENLIIHQRGLIFMSSSVHFEHILLGDSESEENACLGISDGRVVAILVRSSEFENYAEQTRWYLDKGFGSCDQQGLMFPSLDAAKSWITTQLSINYMYGGIAFI
ncbi:hypothetical protein [Methylobacterium bullatum]